MLINIKLLERVKMFVKIEDYKNIYDVDTIIKNSRNNGTLSPETAMDILRMGNHLGNIKKLLLTIKNTDESKLIDYKEFVLSCVDGREVSSVNWNILTELAKAGGYEQELNEVNAKEKIYPTESCKVCCKNGRYIQEDLSKFDVLHHKHEGVIVVWDAKLPKVTDFSECDAHIDFQMTDCSKVERFCFADNYRNIRFLQIGKPIRKGKMPKVLDLSDANKVTFDQCSFEGCEEIKFKKGAVVTFIYTENHPKKLDFSMCSDLMGDLHARDVDQIVFRHLQQADVFMERIHNFNGEIVLLSQLEAQKMSEERKAKKQEEKENKNDKRKNKPSFMKRIFSKNLES